MKEDQGREGGGYIKEVEDCSDSPSSSSSSLYSRSEVFSHYYCSYIFFAANFTSLPSRLTVLAPRSLTSSSTYCCISFLYSSKTTRRRLPLRKSASLSILCCHHACHYSLPPAYVSLTAPHRARQITVLHSSGPDAELQPHLYVSSRGQLKREHVRGSFPDI